MAKIQLNARINTKDNTSVTPTIYDTQCMTVGVSFMSILHIDSSVYIHVFEFREVLRLIKCYSLIAALCQCNTKEEVPDNIYSPARLKHLLHIADHRLSRTTKLRLYRVCVCSSLTHCCEAWTLNRTVIRSINGFNSRCLHVMTGEHYRETASAPAYDLVLAVRRRRVRYLGHVLRTPADRMVRCALMALVIDASHYPMGSLFSDCQGIALPQLVTMASSRSLWRAKVASIS